jgi:hypothetical protein
MGKPKTELAGAGSTARPRAAPCAFLPRPVQDDAAEAPCTSERICHFRHRFRLPEKKSRTKGKEIYPLNNRVRAVPRETKDTFERQATALHRLDANQSLL